MQFNNKSPLDKQSSFDSSIFVNQLSKKDGKVDLSKFEDMSGHVENRKIKKFFKFAIPIFVLEIIALIVLVTYFVILPKNYCTISTNYDNAIVYVNNKETNKFRFEEPKDKVLYYYYPVDISIKLQGEDIYNVTYTLTSDKYEVSVTTSATKQNSEYHLQVQGGEKTQLLSAITIKSTAKIKNFSVKMKINVKKA